MSVNDLWFAYDYGSRNNPRGCPSDYTFIGMANWDYERCDNGQPLFGPDWDDYGAFTGDIESFDEGPNYSYRYGEVYWHLTLGYVVAMFHYAVPPSSPQWTGWNSIVCAESTISLVDPWAVGRVSEPIPIGVVYSEELFHHRSTYSAAGRATLGPSPADYDAGVDAASWSTTISSPNVNETSSGIFRGSDSGANVQLRWNSGAIRYTYSTDAFDDVRHNFATGGRGHRNRVSNAFPSWQSGLQPNPWGQGVFGEDFGYFPCTWLSTYETWALTAPPEVVAAGIKFQIQLLFFENSLYPVSQPFPATVRFEFDDENYPWREDPNQTSPLQTHSHSWLSSDQGPTDDIEEPEQSPVPANTKIMPGSSAPSFELYFNVSQGSYTYTGASGDGIVRSVAPNPSSPHLLDVVLEIDHFKEKFAEGELQANSWTFATWKAFVDPVYLMGTTPPWGGAGTNLITGPKSHEVQAIISSGTLRSWQEVNWNSWVYWIPGEECPPHLRLLQRSDVAKGPFEPIPVTPECGKALRLMGRDVQQNLIPGNLPRTQPNSYP